MARERYLVGVSEDELRPEPSRQTAPQTPRSWLENFWYHHKVGVLVGGFILFALIVLIEQTVNRERPDYTVVLVTKQAYLSEEVTYFENVLKTYGKDVNGDGEVIVQMSNLYFGGGGTVQNANIQALQARLLTGDTLLYVFEPQYAARMTAVGRDGAHCFLTALPWQMTGMSEDGLSWNWAADERHTQDPVLKEFPSELCFGVRYAQPDSEQSAAEYAACVALIEAYATNKPTKK